jgi:hypothetical protein
MRVRSSLIAAILGLCLCTQAFADVVVTVDRYGRGNFAVTGQPTVPINWTFAPDPGPGGLNAVLTYSLPFVPVAGDVFLTNQGIPTDLVRFNIGSTPTPSSIAFYSSGNGTSTADTPTPPLSLYPNLINLPRTGVTHRDVYYTPTSSQPGYAIFNHQVVMYHFITETLVPLPTTAGLGAAGLGLVGLSAFLRRRRLNRA